MALQSCHHHHPPLPEWEDWGWGWEELLRCQLGDAARDGIHGAFPFPALAPLGGAEEEEESPVSSSSSGGGGYLEDAVAHWGDRSKRQRTEAGAAEAPPRCPAMASEDLQCLLQSFWDSSSSDGDLLHDLNTMAPAPETSGFVSGEGAASGREGGRSAAAAAGPPPPFSATAAAAAPRPPLQKATTGSGNYYCGPASSSSCSSMAGRKEGVLYPFAVVRPLVLDGDTLSDVNRRILKRPARPVRHPVGEFACGPAVSSPHGPGLSGKAVVSLTKIRTGGKGTITIIRTRG
ncbi:Protein XRI1 [Hordeum vulgare]|nr:Protein XRI1 [Hordeum vulgare]